MMVCSNDWRALPMLCGGSAMAIAAIFFVGKMALAWIPFGYPGHARTSEMRVDARINAGKARVSSVEIEARLGDY